ncbi:hypothetical protein J7J90_04955 [Candidatus Micrarchaeota archaeon]|nr:hypothetical protein [Candidatus Micrarchaeota archaeon]
MDLEESINKALKNAKNDNEKINVITYYLNYLNQRSKELQDKIRLTESQIDELTIAIEAVKELKNKDKVNFNVGAGIYAPGKPINDDLYVDIGSKYVLKTDSDEVVKISSERLKVQVENLKLLTEEFDKSITQIKKLNVMGREILQRNMGSQ